MTLKNFSYFLTQVEESTVIEFAFGEDENDLTLIVLADANTLYEQRDEAVEKIRCDTSDVQFVRFHFLNVSTVQRSNIAKKYLNQPNYFADDQGTNAIYGIGVCRSSGKYQFNASLSSLGEIQFKFSQLDYNVKNCKLIRRKSDKLYIDSLNRSVVNFWKPFDP